MQKSLRSTTGRLAIVAGLACWAAPVGATQPLETFIELAKRQSFDARESSATRRQREAEADASLGALLPAFTARGVYTRNQYEAAVQSPAGRIVITPQDQWDGFLTLDAPLVDLAAHHRYASSKALARAAQWDHEASKLDVARGVAGAYYQLVGGSALARAARDSVSVGEANLKIVEDRRAAGAATDLDLERARANLERAKQDVADAELLVSLASRSLETLSGLTPSESATFPTDDLHEEAPLDRWISRSGTTPRERAVAEARAAASQAESSARAALLPTISGTAQERFTNATGFSGHSAAYLLQLTALWRFDLVKPATLRAQSAAADVAVIREERAHRAVSDSIFEAHRRVRTGIVKSRAARAQAQAAHRAAELASDRYGAGVATQLDVTQAQRDAFLADAASIQADAELAFARATLRLAAGMSPSSRGAP